jgi:2-C-methyl-D-erythritol 4-phosphate cytidylyltransferase
MGAPTGTAAAIVLAGGSGSRVGAAGNKVYLPVAGRPMIAWSLRAMVGAPGIGPVLLVARSEDREPVAELLGSEPGWANVELVAGGSTRQASELAGLRRLADRIRDGRVDVVLIHDGARPMVSQALLAAVLGTAREVGGAVPGLPRDDLAPAGPDPAGPGTVLTGAPAAGLIAVQTPQGFRAGPLLAAYEEAERVGFVGTDTASCVQRFAPALPIRALPGEGRNFKVTFPHDVTVAERVLGAGFAGSEPASPLVKRGSGAAEHL